MKTTSAVCVFSWLLVNGILTITAAVVHQSVNVSRGVMATDEFESTVSNITSCDALEKTTVRNQLGADCWEMHAAGLGLCKLRCRCLNTTSSFVINQKRCVDERNFKKGCRYVFGTWTWRHGWAWKTEVDPLQVLNMNAYGLTLALNASTRKFTQCKTVSTATYDTNGEWKAFTLLSNESNIIFFKLHEMWHLSWIFEEMSASKKAKIEGRFVLFNVTCTQENVVSDGIESVDISSCVVFKSIGNLAHYYGGNRTIVNTIPTETGGEEKDKSLLIGGIAGGCALLLVCIIALLVYMIYRKKKQRKVTTENQVTYSSGLKSGVPV